MNPKTFYPLVIAAIATILLFPSVFGFGIVLNQNTYTVEPGQQYGVSGTFSPSFTGLQNYDMRYKLAGDSNYIDTCCKRALNAGETMAYTFGQRAPSYPGTYDYNLYAYAYSWGTTTDSKAYTVTVGSSDNVKPSVYISSHKTGDEVDIPSITLSGTASDASGIDKVGIIINAGTQTIASGTTSWTKSISLTEGTNNIVIEAYDKASPQNIGFTTLSITYTKPVVPPIDTTAPTITVQSPADGYTVGTPDILLKGITYDEIGTTEVTAKVGAGTAKTATGTDAWSVPLTLVEDINTITVTATDAAGNTKTTIHTLTYSTSADPADTGTVIITPEPDLITDLFLENTLNINNGEQITLTGTLAHSSATSVDYDVSVYDQATGEIFARTTSIVRVPAGDVISFELPQFALSPGAHTLIIKADTTITALATTRTITVAADGKIADPQIPDLTDEPTQAPADTTEDTIKYIGTFAFFWFISRKIIEYKEKS